MVQGLSPEAGFVRQDKGWNAASKASEDLQGPGKYERRPPQMSTHTMNSRSHDTNRLVNKHVLALLIK